MTIRHLCCLLALSACATGKFVWADDLPPQAAQPEAYFIKAGDALKILIWNQEQLSGTVGVRSDGRVTIPLLGDVAVGGLTTQAASEQIARRLKGFVVEPKVTVTVESPGLPVVSVVGEVKTPGQFPVQLNEGVLHALAKAGGLTEYANASRIYLLRRTPEPVRIRFEYVKLSRGEGRGPQITLRDGDVVVVE